MSTIPAGSLAFANAVFTLTPDKIERVYSGRQGCMCGCLGEYFSDQRNVTRILNILKNDKRTMLQDGYILYIDDQKIGDRERNYVAYLKRPGKKMGDM